MTTLTSPAGPGSEPGKAVGTAPRKRPLWQRILPLVIVLAGVLLLAYPVVVTYLRNASQADQARAYRDSQVTVSQEDRSYWIDRAHKYNEAQVGAPILDPWLARVSKDNRPYRDYLEELNPKGDDSPMAALAIPSIGVALPVYHGTEPETLAHGVGHLYGSGLPVGGEGNHSVLTGHSGLIDATLFDRLPEVKVGDKFYLNVLGEDFTYQVDEINTVLPEDTSKIQPIADRDLVTLITCTPYGVNSHRLLVRGTRVPNDPVETHSAFDAAAGLWQWWMIAAAVAIVLALLALLWLWLRNRKKQE